MHFKRDRARTKENVGINKKKIVFSSYVLSVLWCLDSFVLAESVQWQNSFSKSMVVGSCCSAVLKVGGAYCLAAPQKRACIFVNFSEK